MKDFIISLALIVVIGCAVWYIYKAKKSGKKCIGCPDGCSCNCCPSEGCSSEK